MRRLQSHQVGNVTLAWSCSECNEIFHLGTPYETDVVPDTIEREFTEHDCQTHKRAQFLRDKAKAATLSR